MFISNATTLERRQTGSTRELTTSFKQGSLKSFKLWPRTESAGVPGRPPSPLGSAGPDRSARHSDASPASDRNSSIATAVAVQKSSRRLRALIASNSTADAAALASAEPLQLKKYRRRPMWYMLLRIAVALLVFLGVGVAFYATLEYKECETAEAIAAWDAAQHDREAAAAAALQTTGSNRTLSDDWSWRYFWEGEKHSFDVCLERCAIRRTSAQFGAIRRNSLSTRPRATTGGRWSTRSFFPLLR